MTDKKQNEQQDELRDLDVREEQAEGVKGGIFVCGVDETHSGCQVPDMHMEI